jgi:zinc protease
MTVVAARPRPGSPRDYHFPRFERRVLDNGLTVIIAPVKKLPIVSVAAVIDVTALDDPPGLEGLAALTAQALREGTASRDGNTLVLDLERRGTSIEAGADWDNTVASMTVLKRHLRDAFEIFAEVLMFPAFRAEDVERLKAERLAERLQLLDEPRGLADEAFTRFVYAEGSRYGEPMAGTSATVSRIAQHDVQALHATSYTPEAVTIVMAGDISTDDGYLLANSSFGSWSGERAAESRIADKPARNEHKIAVVGKPDAAQSEIRIGHAGVPRMHPDYFDITVMNAVLGGLFSSRINLNLREQHGYTYGASSFFDWRRQSGPFTVSTAVQSEVTAEAITESLREIDRMRSEEISEEELSLATSYLEGVFPIRYETTAAITAALANLVTFGLPEDYYDSYRANIASVNSAGVLRAAKTHLKPEELRIVVVGNPDIVRAPVEALELGAVSAVETVEP